MVHPQNTKTIEILRKVKESIHSHDIVGGYQHLLEYEKLRPIPDKILPEYCDLLFYFEDFEKAQKYFVKSLNPYSLARFYLHFGEYEKASIEFSKWAKHKNVDGAENTFIMRILFAEQDYNKFIDFTENILISLSTSRYNQLEYFINSISNQIFDSLVISIISHYKCSTTTDFTNILLKKYPGISQLINKKHGAENAFIKNITKTSKEEIDKLVSIITRYPNTNSKTLERTIDYLMDYEKYSGNISLLSYENDPIMMRVSSLFSPYVETKNAFHLFEEIVHDEIISINDYKAKYQLDGLIDYSLLSLDFPTALELLRTKKVRGYNEFILLINLLLLTNNDITASDFIDWNYLFFGKSASKLLISTKESFIEYVDKRISQVREGEGKKFIDTLKEGFIEMRPDYQQNPNMLSEIGSTFSTIYHLSPLYKSIREKEIFWATLNINEKGHACCNKYFINIENDYRASLGIRFRDFGSDSEATVYYFVKKHLPNHNIVLQYSPDWLKPLRLDIFIKELNLAIEYQGEQHYYSTDFYGGEAAFKKRQNNDAKKHLLCKAAGVKLEYIIYTDNIASRVKEILTNNSA